MVAVICTDTIFARVDHLLGLLNVKFKNVLTNVFLSEILPKVRKYKLMDFHDYTSLKQIC